VAATSTRAPPTRTRPSGLSCARGQNIRPDPGARRLVVLPTADHDFSRLATAPRTAAELGAAFAFLLTWGSIPSIYYGDEIGMRYLTGLPDHEGSRWSPGFNRAGCRTPMQWDPSSPNAGFSAAPAERLYLPQDPAPDRPAVTTQQRDPASTLNRVRRLIQLRRSTPSCVPPPPPSAGTFAAEVASH
jgi:glycosidase